MRHFNVFFCLICLLAKSLSADKVRKYYIAAVETDWDYAPSGKNLVNQENSNFIEKTAVGEDRIGRIYKKLIYKRYTDSTFLTEIPNPKWMGILGPTIRAEVGDTVQVFFKNNATGVNLSIHPHGLLYNKHSEGALYLDKTSQSYKTDDSVPAGGSYVYTWNVTDNFGPTRDDNNCIAWSYHSHYNPEADIYSGLTGTILSCRKGVLTEDGENRKDGYKDFILYADEIEEQTSWMITENLNKCGVPTACEKLLKNKDSGFTNSNTMSALNGFIYGNLNFEISEGEKVAWHFISLIKGLHPICIIGQTFTVQGKRTDTLSLFPATFLSTTLVPTNVGKWLIYSRNVDDFNAGMSAYLTVTPAAVSRTKTSHNPTYTYYLSAEEVEWNYGPSGIDQLSGRQFGSINGPPRLMMVNGPHQIGSVYKKARYFEYTDNTFSQKKNRTAGEEYLGILGPVLRAEVGEIIEIVFKNLASRQYSFLPFGVSLEKAEEGLLYLNANDTGVTGKIAQPGETVTYRFSVPYSVSPTVDDPQCLTYSYQSAVDIVKDINSGLVGPLLVCKSSRLTKDRKQRFIDREFNLLFDIFDENKSWYLEENIQKYASDPAVINRKDERFIHSNSMSAINGLSYGNIRGLEMCQNEMISWQVMGSGNTHGLHGVYFDGNTLDVDHTNKDAKIVVPGSSFTGLMVPEAIGKWEVICATTSHFRSGMTGFYEVKKCLGTSDLPEAQPYDGITRTYYIAAVELDWDFAPKKINLITGENLTNSNTGGNIYVKDDAEFVGTTYKKVVFREFTDATFTVQKPRTQDENHLGILGPMIKAEVMDMIKVVFKNMASRPYSIYPHGIFHNDSSGEYNKANHSMKVDNHVQPGKISVYEWKVPDQAGPKYNDPACIPWFYLSSVDFIKDFFSGLAGPLIVCAKGTLDVNGTRNDVDHEFALLFNIFNEGDSWYLQDNIKKFAPNRTDLRNPTFDESNKYSAINGYIYGNVPDLVMGVSEKIAWYVYGFGGVGDYHTIHFHGETFLYRTHHKVYRGDVVTVFPFTSETVEMLTDNPGTWIIHCHVGDHVAEGMEATYTVTPAGKTARLKDKRKDGKATQKSTQRDNQNTRTHRHILKNLLQREKGQKAKQKI